MTIELSNLTFTDQADVVPESGVKNRIVNTGIANTLAGNDTITGTYVYDPSAGNNRSRNGIENSGTLNTAEGNDTITTVGYFSPGIENTGTFNTGDGNDIISADGRDSAFINTGTFNTADGNDVIESSSSRFTGIKIADGSIFDTGNGNDRISGGGGGTGISNASFTFNTGDGNDTIEGSGGSTGIENKGLINTGNGKDTIIARASGGSYYGGRDDIGPALSNFSTIDTGDGEDIITITNGLYNEGFIETGNGDDSIIVEGGVDDDITGNTYGIKNNGGAINMGDGNDSIIANEGFESAENSSGAWFLGEGEDYIKGFGSGDFYGGNGNDTLELTPGTYTVGIWGEAGESPIFTKGNQLMITSEFETLKAGGTTYNFASLTAGQIITVA